MSSDGKSKAPSSAPSVEQFLDFMNKNKMNTTSQRRRIAEAFFNLPGHHTLEEFYQHMHKLDSSIGQTTVYRTLKLLCAAGLASEIHLNGVAHYEIVNEGAHHDHLMCINCGKIVEIYDPEIERMQKKVAAENNFTLLSHYHILYGLCQDCRENQDKDEQSDSSKIIVHQK